MMKAQIMMDYGNPDVFQLQEIPKPILKSGYVLIRVCATSVNPIDCKIRSGAVPGLIPAFPAILQGDVAGVIEAVASDVSQFAVGDEVFGFAGGMAGESGALAEYMLADARLLAKKPATLSMREAAALPVVAITAWTALFSKARLTKEQSVLIHGGLGGVGHIAVQLAKWRGAQVYATLLKEVDIPMVQALGAGTVINANQESVADYVERCTAGQGFDVVFDTVGTANLDRSLTAAANNGTVVTTAARSTHDLTPLHNKGLSLHAVFVLLPIITGAGREGHGQILSEIAALADQGSLRPMLDEKTFTLAQAGEAHAWLESGQARGKVVITISEGA